MNTEKLERIIAIGDIHTEDKRLEAVLSYAKQANIDTILALGDIVDGPGDVNSCCQQLQNANILSVSGNHERWLLENSMRMLPNATFRKDLGV